MGHFINMDIGLGVEFRAGEGKKSLWKPYRFKVTNWKTVLERKPSCDTHQTVHKHTSWLHNLCPRHGLYPCLFTNTSGGWGMPNFPLRKEAISFTVGPGQL